MAHYGASDAGAFDVLYERCRGPLYRYLMRHCDNESSAQELYQEAWTLLRDCGERLLRRLSGLAREQRHAFLLQAEGGLSLEQIAAVTGAGRETASR